MVTAVVSVFLIVVLVISFVWTLRIFKQEENKIKEYEEQGQTAKEELKRAEEYEEKSLHRDMPRLLWIYAITIGLSLVIFGIYFYTI